MNRMDNTADIKASKSFYVDDFHFFLRNLLYLIEVLKSTSNTDKKNINLHSIPGYAETMCSGKVFKIRYPKTSSYVFINFDSHNLSVNIFRPGQKRNIKNYYLVLLYQLYGTKEAFSFFIYSNALFRRTCIQRESLLCAWSPPLNIFVFPAVPNQRAKGKEQSSKSFTGTAGSFCYAKKSNLKYTTATKQTYSEKITMKTQTFQKTINKTVVYHCFHSLKGVPHA